MFELYKTSDTKPFMKSTIMGYLTSVLLFGVSYIIQKKLGLSEQILVNIGVTVTILLLLVLLHSKIKLYILTHPTLYKTAQFFLVFVFPTFLGMYGSLVMKELIDGLL